MKKKLRKLLKKNLLQAKNAFSLVEITVSLLVIAVIVAALTPVISKRLTANSSIKNRISTNCDPYYPDGYCGMCYISPKKCITCTRTCQLNEYKNVDDCKCENCEVRYSDSNCDRCNSQRCTRCKDGYYLGPNNKCVICPVGHYCNSEANGKDSVKYECPVGYAGPREGLKYCIACVKSTVSQTGTVAVSRGQVNCSICPAGRYAKKDAQSTACEVCTVGHYCPAGKYIACPAGTAQSATGKTSCNDCVGSTAAVSGTYANTSGMSSCVVCPNGTYANGSKRSACTACPAGRYCVSGKIIPCVPGTAQSSVGQTSCFNCRKSTSSVQGNVAVNSGQTSCSPCGNGTYAEIDRQSYSCRACRAGSYCPNGVIAQCPVGTYSTGSASSCAPCPAGTTSGVGASSCFGCAAGCASCSGSAGNCTSCRPGYYKSGSSCVYCQAGYYCPGGTSGRISCGSYKSSNAGSSSASQCFSLWGCSRYSGSVSGNLCYKYTAIGACGGTTDGHTWAPATQAQARALGLTSITNIIRNECAGYSRYGCSSYRLVCGAITPSGYRTLYSGCTYNKLLCVTNN